MSVHRNGTAVGAARRFPCRRFCRGAVHAVHAAPAHLQAPCILKLRQHALQAQQVQRAQQGS